MSKRYFSYTVGNNSSGAIIAQVWDETTGAPVDSALFFWPPFLTAYRRARANEWGHMRAIKLNIAASKEPVEAESAPSNAKIATTVLQPKDCDTRQLVSDLYKIALAYAGHAALRERITGAVEQFVAASAKTTPSPDAELTLFGSTLCTKCDWQLGTADSCAETRCPQKCAPFPAPLSHRTGLHERYISGYNVALDDVRTALTRNAAAVAGALDLDEDKVLRRAQEHSLLRVAGDHPHLEQQIIDFVKTCITDAAGQLPQQ